MDGILAIHALRKEYRLTHEKGIGIINVRAVTGPFGQWIDRNWPFLVFMMPMIAIWTVIIAIPVVLSLRRRHSSAKDSSNAEAVEKEEGRSEKGT